MMIEASKAGQHAVRRTEHVTRSLMSIAGEPMERLRAILYSARDVQPSEALSGRSIATVFFEDSTRTKLSFAIAAQKLGAILVELATGASSVNKGETTVDTAVTLAAMGVEAVIVRAKQAGTPQVIGRHVPGLAVINAGDGRHEHPTQALADALTIAEAFDRPDFDFRGLRVAIVGDVNASRVARSNIAMLTGLGAKVVCAGPASLVSPALAATGCDVTWSMEEAVAGANVVMMLRIQFERYAEGQGAIASPREYRAEFGMTAERAAALGPTVAIMHPGPTNRGLEIDPEVADGQLAGGPRSLIRAQVSNGVRARMAVLLDCLS